MEESRNIMEKNTLSETVILCSVVGMAHVLAQNTMMGICGLRLDTGFILGESILYILAGSLAGAVIWACCKFLSFFASRGKAVKTAAPGRRQRLFSVILFLYVGLVLCFTLCVLVLRSGSFSWWRIFAMFALCIPCVMVLLSVIRRVGLEGAAHVRVALIITVSFLACGTSTYILFSSEVISNNGAFLFPLAVFTPLILGVVLAAAVCRFALSMESVLSNSSKKAAAVLAAALSVLFILNLVLWQSVLPLRAPWCIYEKPGERGETAASGGPNVILIVFDTLRGDYMELFGGRDKTMPFVSSFAGGENTVCSLIRAQSPWTLSSHASIFTGTYPARHGAHRPFLDDSAPPPFAYPLGPELTTIAGELGGLGYSTAGISANYGPLSVDYGCHRGFSYYDARPGAWYWIIRLSPIRGIMNHMLYRVSKEGSSGAQWLESLPCITRSRWEPSYRRAGEINDEILSRLGRDRLPGRPFFLFVNFFDPHIPYFPPDGYNVFISTEERAGKPRPHSTDLFYRAYKALKEGRVSREVGLLEALYKGELLYLDRQFESLVGRLHEEGFLDNTLVILTSDHGEAFAEHGFLKHGNTLYDPELAVPVIIRYPESLKSRARPLANNFQHVDFLPTIMELIGHKAPAEVEGRAFGTGQPFTVSELYASLGEPALNRELKSLVRGSYKYIHSSTGAEELYNLDSDPGERRNLIETSNVLADSLRAELEMWQEKYRERKARGLSDKPRLNAEAIERLRALGYVK